MNLQLQFMHVWNVTLHMYYCILTKHNTVNMILHDTACFDQSYSLATQPLPKVYLDIYYAIITFLHYYVTRPTKGINWVRKNHLMLLALFIHLNHQNNSSILYVQLENDILETDVANENQVLLV